MFRLGPAGLDANDQKLLRNEICASNSIYESGVARALDLNKHPGSWGVYKKGRDIVSVADIGMAGKPLNQVLRELSKQPDADKVAIAKYFAVAMTRNLEVIHAGDVIWNNLDLSNFYVRPDGGTHAYDFTESKEAANQAAKDAEFNALVAGPVLDMYRILFPIGDEAIDKFAELVAQGPAHALVTDVGIVGALNQNAVRDALNAIAAESSAAAAAAAAAPGAAPGDVVIAVNALPLAVRARAAVAAVAPGSTEAAIATAVKTAVEAFPS
jgi:hypothetical protein